MPPTVLDFVFSTLVIWRYIDLPIKQGKFYFMEEPSNAPTMWGVMEGDVLESLKKLPENLADCIVTSPPYFSQVDYGCNGEECGHEDTVEEYLDFQTYVANELLRVAKPGANLFWVIRDSNNQTGGTGGDYQLPDGSYSCRVNGANDPAYERKSQLLVPELTRLRFYESGWLPVLGIIWDKNDSRRGAEDRPSYSYEHILLFSKTPDRYWAPDAVLREYSEASLKQLESEYKGEATFDYDSVGEENPSNIKRRVIERMKKNPGARLRAVWTISSGSQPRVVMPDGRVIKGLASFPLILAEICINLGCPKGGWVLDPYSGMGTTLLAASKWGRNSIGVELSPVYVEATRERMKEYTENEINVEDFIAYIGA